MTVPMKKSAFDSAEPYSEWSAPDISVINEGRRPPVPMPSDIFGSAWDIVTRVADDTSTYPDYAGIALIACTASLIGGKRRLRPYTTSVWSVLPIIWACAVGDPSSRKTPALEAFTKPMSDLEAEKAELHKDEMRNWREKSEWARAEKRDWQERVKKAIQAGEAKPHMPKDAEEPENPHRGRTITMDTTPESLGPILQGNPDGVLAYRDELAGWFLGFERYAPGGREFWLEAYNGGAFVIDRKSSEDPIIIPFNGVSVLGGIQPIKLASALLASADDGLSARFLWAWPDKRSFEGRPASLYDHGQLIQLYRRLDSLRWETDGSGEERPITLLLAPAAADIFEEWQIKNGKLDNESASHFKSFVGKLEGLVLRLALVAEYLKWAVGNEAEPREVSVASLIDATKFVDEYAKPMAERVFGDAALPQVERDAALLGRYILKHELRTLNLRTLKQYPHKTELAAIRKADKMRAAADFLVDAGWLKPCPKRDGKTVGRASLDFIANPLLWEL